MGGPTIYGEQLVLDTYLARPRRRIDCKRQNELAKPRLLQTPADSWLLRLAARTGGTDAKGASANAPAIGGDTNVKKVPFMHKPATEPGVQTKRVHAVVERLSTPSIPSFRSSPTPRQRVNDINSGEATMCRALKTAREKLQDTSPAEVVARVTRPTVPRTYVPPSGEIIALTHAKRFKGRVADLDYIARLATPRIKEGADSGRRPRSAPATRSVAKSLNPRLVAFTAQARTEAGPPEA